MATENYFNHVNGEWLAANPIPADQVRWGSFAILNDENLARVKYLCETTDSPIAKLYASYVTLPTIISPYVTDLFMPINAITNVSDCLEIVGKMCKRQLFPFFVVDSLQVAKEPDTVVSVILQVGLRLPDIKYNN